MQTQFGIENVLRRSASEAENVALERWSRAPEVKFDGDEAMWRRSTVVVGAIGGVELSETEMFDDF